MSDSARERIAETLEKLVAEGHRIIWWTDPDGEFAEMVGELQIDHAETLLCADHAALALKRRVELDAPDQRFIIYEAGHPPAPEKDWCLDIRLYAEHFAADVSSMLLQDLGLRQLSLREHLQARSKFLASKERVGRLADLISPDDDSAAVDAKILAVLSRTTQFDAFTLIAAVLSAMADDSTGEPEATPLWRDMEKYGLTQFFWKLVTEQFGYSDDAPKLWPFVLRLFVTDLAHTVRQELPATLQSLRLPAAKAAGVSVFLSQWRDSTSRQALYDQLASRVAAELKIADCLGAIKIENFGGSATFIEIERRIANGLRDDLLGNKAASVARAIKLTASKRMEGYWANTRWPDNEVANRRIWHAYYAALISATELFELKEQYQGGFLFESPEACYQQYEQKLFRFDQYYRRFHEHADKVYAVSADAMAPLTAQVEATYLNNFLAPLAQRWDGFLEKGLLETWALPNIPKQHEFFRNFVEPQLEDKEDRRIFVIISDAMRFEVAEELQRSLNGRNRIVAELKSQLGVLPSYTKLGMASLLPHEALKYTAKGLVQVDGQSSEGLEARKKILAEHQGLAVRAEDFIDMGKTQSRELVKGHRFVYIYHNRIDATGDSAGTESQTFSAVRDTIRELSALSSKLVGNLNASRIVITADHGFLYRETALEALDKNKLDTKPAGAFYAKKRYLVGKDLGTHSAALSGYTRATAGTDDETMFWVPRGVNRFHFVSGARFVHGGASLQECVVPVLLISAKRGAGARNTAISQTSATVLGNQFRITTNRPVFTLLQTEPATDRVKPRSITVGLINQSGEAVSSTEIMHLDSKSDDLTQRQRKITLSVLDGNIQRGDHHYLTLVDADTGAEQHRIEVRIDLAISNEFDF